MGGETQQFSETLLLNGQLTPYAVGLLLANREK
jgi:hypothetical protein